jgi:hypothetical protein
VKLNLSVAVSCLSRDFGNFIATWVTYIHPRDSLEDHVF